MLQPLVAIVLNISLYWVCNYINKKYMVFIQCMVKEIMQS